MSKDLSHITKLEGTQEFITEWNSLDMTERNLKMREFGMVYNPYTVKPKRQIRPNLELIGEWDDGRRPLLNPFGGIAMKIMEIKDNKVIALYGIDRDTDIIGTEDILEDYLTRND